MRIQCLLLGILLALAGCESMEPEYQVHGNTVVGEGVGYEGFSFQVPPGYKVYNPEVDEKTPTLTVVDRITDTLFRGGSTPYKVLLYSDHEAIAFVPISLSSRPQYQRISDAHSRAVTQNFAILADDQKERVLYDMVSTISVHGETYQDYEYYVDDSGPEPLGVYTFNVIMSEYSYLPFANVKRLGNAQEVYCAVSIGEPMSFEKGLEDSKTLLYSLELDPNP